MAFHFSAPSHCLHQCWFIFNETLGTNREILMKIKKVLFKRLKLKMPSAKWRLFCLCNNFFARCLINPTGIPQRNRTGPKSAWCWQHSDPVLPRRCDWELVKTVKRLIRWNLSNETGKPNQKQIYFNIFLLSSYILCIVPVVKGHLPWETTQFSGRLRVSLLNPTREHGKWCPRIDS